jgi:hypothetical protein
LSATSEGFTVAELTAKVHTMTGHTDYTIRHPPSGLRPAQTPRQGTDHQTRQDPPLPPHTPERRHHRRPARPARTRHRTDPRRNPQPPDGTKTHHLDPVDRDYEKIRINMQTLFHDHGLNIAARAA